MEEVKWKRSGDKWHREGVLGGVDEQWQTEAAALRSTKKHASYHLFLLLVCKGGVLGRIMVPQKMSSS